MVSSDEVFCQDLSIAGAAAKDQMTNGWPGRTVGGSLTSLAVVFACMSVSQFISISLVI